MPDTENFYDRSDEFSALVCQRTGLLPKEMVCPREKSEMTPCIARDGRLACSDDGNCVGCDRRVVSLLKAEKDRVGR